MPEAPVGFEPAISCLLGRRFNQLSHGAKRQGRLFYSYEYWQL